MNKKKICLITGANSELGIAMAERFRNEYTLILCWHNDETRIQAFQDENIEFIRKDLSHEANCKELIEYCFSKYSKIDLLINCIGKNINIPDNEITEKEWDEVLAVNLKPAFFLCKYFQRSVMPDIEKNICDCGCIINISSTAGIRAIPSSPHYIAAKAGLIALSEYFAKILAPFVRVNTIAPGFIETIKHSTPKYNALRESIPMRRFATLSEIADTAAYIAQNKYITAQTIVVDGGMIS